MSAEVVESIITLPGADAREKAARALGLQDRVVSTFCLIDAAQDDGIYPRLRAFAADTAVACLYQGDAAEELADVAPYLVGLDDAVFDWLWGMWDRPWGVFVRSTATIDDLRAHFRRLTKVATEDGTVLLFRFYDPRVFAPFLPTCDAAQLDEVFGPVSGYAVTQAGELAWYRRTDAGVQCVRIVLRA